MRTRAIVAGATAVAVSLLLAGGASADLDICAPGSAAGECASPQGVAVDRGTGRLYVADRGNRRIDVFASDGDFEFAFGWGVVDGSAELQSCGPAATPPTASCLKGSAGGGAGQFTNLDGIAVDNDPGSPSHHAVYALDGSAGARVQKFDPAGGFLLAWGGGVITGGAAGTGDLIAGSDTVSNVKTLAKAFAPGQTIGGAGIPAGTKIVGLGPGKITLSSPASSSATGAALSVTAGPGNVPVNEIQTLTVKFALPGDGFRLTFSTPNPSPTTDTTEGAISALGGTAVDVQEALEDLSNIGPGNVLVTGPVGGPFAIEFTGPRYADTDVNRLFLQGSGEYRLTTTQQGGSGAEICAAPIAESCAGGAEGAGPGQFAQNARLGVGPGGTVHVADSVEDVLASTPGDAKFDNRLQRFTPLGVFSAQHPLPESDRGVSGLAVDSGGSFYVATGGFTHKYGAGGGLLAAVPGSEVSSVAVDATDNLFVGEREAGYPVIAEYDASGATLRRFGYGTLTARPPGIAPFSTAAGDIYASDGDLVRHISLPPPGPVIVPAPCSASPIGNLSATLRVEVNPEGKPTTAHFEYVDDATYQADVDALGAGHGFDHAQRAPANPVDDPAVGGDFSLHGASVEIDGLTPGTTYRCRAVASNPDADRTGPEGTFQTLPALLIEATWATAVNAQSAVLNASINPLGLHTEGYFEYVDEESFQDSGFATAARVPDVDGGAAPIDFGAGNGPVTASTPLTGLSPNVRYRYRVVGGNALDSEVLGPVHSFRTFFPPTEIPDERRYEQVSPVEKNNAEVAVPGTAGGLFEDDKVRIQAASPTGDAITYTSFTAFGDAVSAPGTSQYLSRRTGGGWVTQNINPFGYQNVPMRPPYRGFTANLAFGASVVSEPACAEGAPAGFESLCLVDTDSGKPVALTQGLLKVADGVTFCAGYAGASADGRHAVFAANGAFGSAPEGQGFNLYEWSAGEGLSLVSILPGEEPAQPSLGTGFGAGSDCSWGTTIVRNAISVDGERIFWTYAPSGGTQQLLARLGGEETVQLDAVEDGEGPPGGGQFLSASSDGSKVIFMAPGSLTDGAGANSLYRYDFDAPGGERLTDLAPAIAGPANVVGLLGAGEDGDHAYFAAAGSLVPGAPSGNCSGSSSKCNLYLYREGEGVRLVATLTGADGLNWSLIPSDQTARVTPDGRHLAFTSVAPLTGYDSTVEGAPGCELESEEGKRSAAGGNPACAQVFVYDAEGDDLLCASCNPSGGRPAGPALLPTWSNPFEQPHYLSDDGSRLFFETLDALVPADTNGRFDIYEFERPGAGSCTPQSPGFVDFNGGCVFLISNGKSKDESYLVDASSSGRDVFISTRAQLVGQDEDERYDVYDFREGGGFPEPEEKSICTDLDACHSPSSMPPAPASPATGSFNGPGNLRVGSACSRPARSAKKQRRRAGALRRQADRAAGSGQERKLRRRAARHLVRAKRLTRVAKRCRAARGARR